MINGYNVNYEIWESGRKVRYTHPIASGALSCSGCGPAGSIFVDHPISITVDGVKYFYLYVDMDAKHSFEFWNPFRINGLGSVTEVIDRNETVVNTYRYSPFGESLVKNETVFNPYQFSGRRFDEESGLYYYRARMYSALQSRFMSNDPARDGANLYAYVGNNPTGRRDPSGKWLGKDAWCIKKAYDWSGKAKMQAKKRGYKDRYMHCWMGCKLGKRGCSKPVVKFLAGSKEFAAVLQRLIGVPGKKWEWDDYHATMWGWRKRNRRQGCGYICISCPYLRPLKRKGGVGAGARFIYLYYY